MKHKKKVIALILFSLGCAGVVQASSIHGDYNGDPIVKLFAEGKELLVEDAPAVIRDGRTMVPLYLLRQAGVAVHWVPEKYAVELTLPDPIQKTDRWLFQFKAVAKDHGASNARLVTNEYGSFLQVDVLKTNSSNTDNDNIIALSGILTDSSADMLVVNGIRNNRVEHMTAVSKADLVEYQNKKLKEHEFIAKWNYFAANDVTLVIPNLPPEPAPLPTPNSNTWMNSSCEPIALSYQKAMKREVEEHNKSISKDTEKIDQILKNLQDGMNSALEGAGCPPR
jgi:hypothetical protein